LEAECFGVVGILTKAICCGAQELQIENEGEESALAVDCRKCVDEGRSKQLNVAWISSFAEKRRTIGR
jgi:hypothetical protein